MLPVHRAARFNLQLRLGDLMQHVAIQKATSSAREALLITFQWKEHLVTQEPGKTKSGAGGVGRRGKPTCRKLLEVSLNIFFGHGKSFACGTACNI